jgi:NADH dehydrogenase/NADH:ubiquinone oxidoreductase subunit G
MKIIGIICLLAVMAPVSAAGAEYYQYTDQHGNIIYTDDIKEIPDAQRATARVADGRVIIPLNSGTSVSPTAPELPVKDAAGDLKAEQEKLEALKSKLEKEYESLAQENARLKAAQKTAVTPAQRKAYNKEVVSFNTRFQAYKEKEAAYKSRLEKHYQRIDSTKSERGED